MQTTTIQDIEVIYESKTSAKIQIKGTPDAICKVLQKLNDNQIKLNK
jgi:hypothetical protein